MRVNICSFGRLVDTIKAWKPDMVVSAIAVDPAPLTSSDSTIPPQRLMVPIEDIYNAQLAAYKNAIRNVLAMPGQRILVHCEHGQSRSAALAIAKIYQWNPDGVEVFLKEHPEAEPNPLLLLLADELLHADGNLLRRCRHRYKGRKL